MTTKEEEEEPVPPGEEGEEEEEEVRSPFTAHLCRFEHFGRRGG